MQIILLFALLLASILGWLLWKKHIRLGPLTGGGRTQERRRILLEDALKHLFKTERKGQEASIEGLGGKMEISRDQAAAILSELQEKKMLRADSGKLQLTDEARAYALHIIRAHRLWERYLADRTGLHETDWHDRAEALEHSLTRAEADRMAAELGNPTHDPHGDPVPGAKGDLRSLEGESMQSLALGNHARILHVEDEPESVYRSLLEKQIHPGMDFELMERNENGLVLRSEGRSRSIDFVEAGNITVQARPTPERRDQSDGQPLHILKPGEIGRVVLVSKAARSVERRRFMDLGILPGALIQAELNGPGGDPKAYRVRGSLLALRREQAENILVKPVRQDAS